MASLRRLSSGFNGSRKSPYPINEEIDEGTMEGRDRMRGIWRTFRGPAFELKPGGRDAYRSAELSPLSTFALPGRDRLAFTGRDRLSASQRVEPPEKYSSLARNRRGCGS